jgi:hypothetical protein
MEDYQTRVVEEKEELNEKIEKLSTFLSKATEPDGECPVGEDELDRMQRQLDCMNAYSGILGERIDAFGDTTEEEE